MEDEEFKIRGLDSVVDLLKAGFPVRFGFNADGSVRDLEIRDTDDTKHKDVS